MHNPNKVRWAILGSGFIANQFAIDFKAVKNAEIVAVASSYADQARGFAAQYNIPHILSIDEL